MVVATEILIRTHSHEFRTISTTTSTSSALIPSAPCPGIGWCEDEWISSESAYFIGMFLPTLLESFFSIPWKILDVETKSLEPSQLACPGGGRATRTLLLTINGVSGLFSPLLALFTGQLGCGTVNLLGTQLGVVDPSGC